MASRTRQRGEHPNVILIVADDLGYGDLGCFGNPVVRTPNLDRLAAGGITLTQHYAASPVCAPARAGLLTGRYPQRTGAVDVPSNRGLDRIALRETTLADAFRAAGYATGMVGKWHNGVHDLRFHPRARGFDEFVGFLNGGMDYWQWSLDDNGTIRTADGSYLTDVFSDAAVSFVERHQDAPFFLYLAYNAPHSPFQAPTENLAHFTGLGHLTRAVATIYAMIERMDQGIGRMLAALVACGLDDNTIVVFTSDNGPWLGGEGEDACARDNGVFSGGKYDVLEGGIRVPALVRWPGGLPAGIGVAKLVHATDWLPTLLALADAPAVDAALDGRDVSPILRGHPMADGSARCWQWNRYEPVSRCNAAIRDGDWKLAWPPIPEAVHVKDPADQVWYHQALTAQPIKMPITTTPYPRAVPAPRPPRLFNLAQDPGEHHDLAADHPERVRDLRARWEAWFAAMEHDRVEAQMANGLSPTALDLEIEPDRHHDKKEAP